MSRSSPRQQKDAMGFWLCRVPACGRRVAKGRRSYCSDACAEAFEIAYFPGRTRLHVFKRDKGVCAKCGTDTERMGRIFAIAGKLLKSGWYDSGGLVEAWRSLGYHGHWSQSGDRWQADHIHECVKGGWGSGLENLRTLCSPCHKAETARLARELACERRAKSA
jgi:5-methylcytosine-specific restriction protein A